MNKHTTYSIFKASTILLFAILFSGNCLAQDRSKLESQRKRTLKEIEMSNKLLKEKQKEKQASMNELLLLKTKIKNRENLIKNYQTELRIITNEITNQKNHISKLQNEIKEIKEEYAKLIVSAYNNRHSYDKWMFVFSARDFNQAYRRLKYIQQFTDYRTKQIELINQKQELANIEIIKLENIKAEKEELLAIEKTEQLKLDDERKDVSRVVSNLKKKERLLRAEIKKKEKESKRIKRIIDKIIAEETERKRRLEEEAKKKGKPKFAVTPEETLISENFGNNMGKFPWPTERGIVTSSYGEHAHPVLKGIKTYNNGIDISTTKGSTVRAIFKGEVRDVWSIQGKNMAVIIKHGDYFSVYQNLRDVKVRTGDVVTSKQEIGTVFTDANDGNKTVLHIEIWKGSKSQNPQKWLARKK